MRALHAQIRSRHLQRPWQIALHGELPDLRVTDAEIWIDAERVRSRRAALSEAIGKRKRARRAVLLLQALRQRRLLCELQHRRQINRGVVVEAVTSPDHNRR